MGIFAALEISAVSRLHHTFNGLKKKHRTQIQDLKALFDPRNSYQNYRNATQSLQTASVPYMYEWSALILVCIELTHIIVASP